jgi:branched-chain amino acid transport system permease protein
LGFYLVLILTGLSSAASLFLVAVGLSIVFGVTRVVNFAHGSFYMLGAYLALTFVELLPPTMLGFWGGILLGSLAVGLIGLLVEVAILRRLYRSPELFQLLATFGVVLVVQDLALWVWGPVDRVGPRPPGLTGSVPVLDGRLPLYDLVLIAACPIVLSGLWLLFRRTRWGTLVRAATADREMVAALGVDERWLFTGVFVLGAGLAGLGGALQLPKDGADLFMDLNIIAAAFVVVVVGGMGSIAGAFVASLLFGQLNAWGVLLLPQITLVLMFLVMAVVLVVRPWGLLGRPEAVAHGGTVPEPPLRPASGLLKAAGTLILALLLALPLLVGDYGLVVAVEMLIMALFAASLHAMMGPGGMISFGHAAYFGGGAYAAALLIHHAGATMLPALVMAPVAAFLLALLFGWFCVRLSGVYLAMLTLAFAQIAWSIVQQWTAVTGGDDGILGIWPADWVQSRAAFYYLVLACSLAGIMALRHLLFSPFGWSLRAVRDSQLRAEAVGIDTVRARWLGFAIAGAAAGLAGGLYVFSKGSIFPDEMAIPRSIDALLMVLLGGVQSLAGPLIGAFAYTGLHELFARMTFWRLAVGATILVLCLAFPHGLAGLLERGAGAGRPERPERKSA